MSTASLRRDHALIEKVLKSMTTAIHLLESDIHIPQIILDQTIDFTKNFTDVCHHTKEEKSLFPALEASGMPTRLGPIAVMLMDHRRARELADEMESAAAEYAQTGKSRRLTESMRLYVQHVTEHLWKENNRLFVMAEVRLQHNASAIDSEMNHIEDRQMQEVGRDRSHYERMVHEMDRSLGNIHST